MADLVSSVLLGVRALPQPQIHLLHQSLSETDCFSTSFRPSRDGHQSSFRRVALPTVHPRPEVLQVPIRRAMRFLRPPRYVRLFCSASCYRYVPLFFYHLDRLSAFGLIRDGFARSARSAGCKAFFTQKLSWNSELPSFYLPSCLRAVSSLAQRFPVTI
jgi:hypothetical protein